MLTVFTNAVVMRISFLFHLLLLARYVPNAAKRSAKLTTDRPLIWKNVEWRYLHNGSSDPLHVWFMVLGMVFGVGGSNGAISGWTKYSKYIQEKTMREE